MWEEISFNNFCNLIIAISSKIGMFHFHQQNTVQFTIINSRAPMSELLCMLYLPLSHCWLNRKYFISWSWFRHKVSVKPTLLGPSDTSDPYPNRTGFILSPHEWWTTSFQNVSLTKMGRWKMLNISQINNHRYKPLHLSHTSPVSLLWLLRQHEKTAGWSLQHANEQRLSPVTTVIV